MSQLVDTHAHLHFEQYKESLGEVLERSRECGVGKIVTVGIDDTDSQAAVDLAAKQAGVFASVGLHPHEAKKGRPALEQIKLLAFNPNAVAIGECGLDYYRNLSDKKDQEVAFRFQIELALELAKPIIFHVRDAFDDFVRIIGDYPNARGIIHSFSSDRKTAEVLVEKGFYIGLNGIMTFTKDPAQLEAAKSVPLDKLVLETDSPFLSPHPNRGKTNEPSSIKIIAEFLAELRSETSLELSTQTTANASSILGLN